MRLHFGDPQIAALIVFAVIAAGLTAIFILVAASSRRDVEFARIQKAGYALRRFWFAFLMLLATAIVVTSLFNSPYSHTKPVAAVVHVTAGQFYWTLSSATLKAGDRVRFDVTSVDVNHGMGLYNPDGQLIGSVQAMPGYHNKIDLMLKQSGRYMISCLEYCGVGHHLMTTTFKVGAR